MDQDLTPVIDAIEQFSAGSRPYFCIPAHRGAQGVDERTLELLGPGVFAADLTETDGLDDLHHPEGAIRDAQMLAASFFGADRCWFLVNGTTCGNEAMILAAVKPGEKILAARNCHKSVLMGMVLSGAVPVWILPEYMDEWNIFGAVRPETVEEALAANPEIRAVIITSPTYYGICSDIRKIAEICHRHGAALLVDEAHGSHLYFGSALLPEGAIAQGADAAALSMHKTGGSMTQSSLLLYRQQEGGRLSGRRLDDALKMVMSSSPSYVLMAALDGARHMAAARGREMVGAAAQIAGRLCRRLSDIPGVEVLQTGDQQQDLLRVVFSAADRGWSGYALKDEIYRRFGISMEMADTENLVCVVTWANTAEDADALADAVGQILMEDKKDLAGWDSGRQKIEGQDLQPEMRMTPREAWYAESTAVPLCEAAGMTAAESVIPYPPGIPLVCPGEMITTETAELLLRYRDLGAVFHGVEDEGLETIRAVQLPEGRKTD